MHCTCGHWVLSLAPPLLCPCVQAPACHRRRGACIRGQAQGISCFPNESLAPKNVSGQSAAPKGVWLGQPPAAWPCTVLHAAPRYNPQNVSDPQVLPQLDFSAEDAVKAQLDALLSNDHPWPNHGLQTMYEFGEDIGGMERSRYFGFSKDLYHFDHFMGQFQNAFPELINADSYELGQSSRSDEGDGVRVDVTVQQRGTTAGQGFCFVMKQKDIGRKKGCWMTKTIKKL